MGCSGRSKTGDRSLRRRLPARWRGFTPSHNFRWRPKHALGHVVGAWVEEDAEERGASETASCGISGAWYQWRDTSAGSARPLANFAHPRWRGVRQSPHQGSGSLVGAHAAPRSWRGDAADARQPPLRRGTGRGGPRSSRGRGWQPGRLRSERRRRRGGVWRPRPSAERRRPADAAGVSRPAPTTSSPVKVLLAAGADVNGDHRLRLEPAAGRDTEPLLQARRLPARARRRPEPGEQGRLGAALSRHRQPQHRERRLSGPQR